MSQGNAANAEPNAGKAEATGDDSTLLTQADLARRWQVSPATLERWRSGGVGPKFMKMQGQVRYRQIDIVEYERACLRRSTGEAA